MLRVAILPIRIGEVASEPVRPEHVRFYQTVASLLTRHGTAVVVTNLASLETLPIDHETRRDGDLILRRLTPAWAAIRDELEVVVVDLTHSQFSQLPDHHIIGAVLALADQDQTAGGRTKFIILIPTIPAVADIVMCALAPYLESGQVALIADAGTTIGSLPEGAALGPDTYADAIRDARIPPIYIVKKKLVRRIGHFRRHRGESDQYCARYSYDGRFCHRELVGLLADFVHRSLKQDADRLLLYHCPISNWLYDVVSAVAIEEDIACLDADPLLRGGKLDIGDHPLLIVPLVDTGATIKQIASSLHSSRPSSRPRVLSILSTSGPAAESGQRVVECGSQSVVVEYVLRVEQRAEPYPCPLCLKDVAETRLGEQQGADLSPLAAWTMILEAGVKLEDDVPPYRPSLGYVPDLTKLIEDNGPFLASQIDGLLSKLPGRLPSNPIVLCPDEAGARALAECLETLLGYTVIRIPHTEINIAASQELGERRLPVESDPEPTGPWKIQLPSLARLDDRRKVVIIDEFNASGRTRLGLARIADASGLDVHCYLSLMDFAKRPLEPFIESFCRPALSLYALPIYPAASRGDE